MSSLTADISVVVFASRQGILLQGTMLSVERAVGEAREAGMNVEVLVATYAADKKTAAWVRERSPYRVLSTADSCLGKARNLALDETRGHHVAFLDGADIWSRNFLVGAAEQDQRVKRDVVWRPAVSIGFANDYFDASGYSVRQIPNSSDFDRSSILVDNPFPSTFFARRRIVETHRFPTEDLKRGWTDVDWWWNANLLGYDIEQITVPDTLHYFRSSLAQERARENGTVRLGPTALELGKRRRG